MTFLWTTTFLACVCSLDYGLVTGEEFDIPLAQDRSGIVWYVEGAPQAAVAAPNPTQPDLTIPTPDMSDTAIPTHEANNPVSTTAAPQANNNENTTIPTGSPAVAPQANNENNTTTAVPTGSNEITTTVATAAVSSVDNATTGTPASATETSPSTPPPPPPAGGLLNGVESLLWGKPNPTPGVTDPDTSNTLPTVSPSLITKICAVSDFNLDALCPSASPDPQCISLASTLGGPYTAQCARMGLCSLVGGTEGRIFIWKVPKAASCASQTMRVSLRAPKRGKHSGPDFIKY
uniref:Uncharacterized protein n=1 Tax=Cacopsylla melanoneura TaxID=428564 RepID=A0A8D8UCK1_9HEMI